MTTKFYKVAVIVLLVMIPTSTAATTYYYEEQQGKLNTQLSNSNSTLTAQIATLNSEVASINNQIASLGTLVGNVNTTLKAQIFSLQTQVNSLSSQVSTIDSKVTTLQSDVSVLQSQVSSLMTLASQLQMQINQILSQLANLAQGRFQATAGPVTIFVDYKSFNFTRGSQTTSQTAWVLPTVTDLVFWLRLENTASDSSVMLQKYTALIFTPYSSSGLGSATTFYMVDSSTVNPASIFSYNQTTNPYVLPAASPSGVLSTLVVKFGSNTQGGTGPQALPSIGETAIVRLAIYYVYRGQVQGETVSFVTARSCPAFPNC